MKSSFEAIPALCNNELSTAQTSGDVMRHLIGGEKVFSARKKLQKIAGLGDMTPCILVYCY